MTYLFTCRLCGYVVETNVREPVPWCKHPGGPRAAIEPMSRDYRAEAASPQVANLKREREAGGPSAVRDMFLPTAKEYESPSDPDGSKGIRKWAEEHQPADGNKRPSYPDIPKKSFRMGS